MLTLTLREASVVVISDSNNPRLLNPDFLERNSIVPRQWQVSNTLVTPPFSMVEYSNGVRIQLEESRLQVLKKDPREENWGSELALITTTLLDVLPHVTYRATGLNYVLTSDEPRGRSAEDQLIERLMQRGPWETAENGLTGLNLEFQYKNSTPQFSLKVGARQQPGSATFDLEGYLLVGNVHHDFGPEDRAERRSFIGQLSDHYKTVNELIHLLPLDPSWQSTRR